MKFDPNTGLIQIHHFDSAFHSICLVEFLILSMKSRVKMMDLNQMLKESNANMKSQEKSEIGLRGSKPIKTALSYPWILKLLMRKLPKIEKKP